MIYFLSRHFFNFCRISFNVLNSNIESIKSLSTIGKDKSAVYL